MINTILFDMDGVLVDSEPLFINRSIKVLEYFGFNYNLETLISCIGTSYDETNRILSQMINQQLPENYNEVEATLCPIDSIDYKQYKMKGLDQLLDYIKAQGFKTALCSSSPLETIQIITKSLELDSFFDVILTGEAFTHNKPHPEIYLNAMKQLNREPHLCLIIEDSEPGLKAAKDSGALPVCITNPFYNIDKKDAEYTIDSLEEVIQLINKLNNTL